MRSDAYVFSGSPGESDSSRPHGLNSPWPEQLVAMAQQLMQAAQDWPGNAYPRAERQVSHPVMLHPDRNRVRDDHFLYMRADEIWRGRRKREAMFGETDIFGEPAWDILLDLLRQERDGRDVSVTSACIGASVPLTTALRWLTILEKKGFVQREDDGRDNRRSFVRLTERGRDLMRNFLLNA